MKTPIFGGDAVSRSQNLVDNQMWNIYPEVVDTKDGKAIGALYSVPGLDLKATAGVGPIRAGGMSVVDGIDGLAYIVSGVDVYSIDANYVVTLVGTLPNALTSPVSMVNNGRQLIIFDGIGGYLVPGGYPLLGGTISSGGAGYAVDDDITLVNTDGTSNATAVINVTSVSGGAVTAFTVSITGTFDPQPTGFTQASTTGSGSDFVLSAATYSPRVGVYTVPLPFAGPQTGVFQDGFGLVNEAATDQWWQSALNDLSIWPVLTFTAADATPDDIIALADTHREVWVIKQKNTEIWVNGGSPGFSFQRLQGVLLNVGCVAPYSVANSGESLIWLAQNSQGQGIVVRTQGYAAIPISTQAIDNEIQQYTTLSDAIGYCYQQGGHVFYMLTFPSANTTWCYDVTASLMLGVPMWHRRAAFSNGAQNRHWSNAYLTFGGVPLVGDYQNGNIYAFNLNTYTDNGSPRKWLRTWRALPQPTMNPVSFPYLMIDMETGVTAPAGTNPQCTLRCSDNDGHNWPITRIGAVGKPGETSKRVMFTRLGSTRRNGGLDRIFELSSSDNFRAAIINAEISDF